MARTSNKSTTIEQGCPGVISTHELYTIAEAKRRLGWSDSAYRAAKRRGLTVLACGKRRYVTGLSILKFLESGAGSDPGS
jgi:hypothetical protein